MTRTGFLRSLSHAVVVASALALAACGGGGGGGGGSIVASGGIIGGTGFKGPVGNATVTAYAIVGGVPGAQLGSTTTDASGKFSVGIGTYAGPVMLQLAGGSYVDEATGTTMPMANGDVMTAMLPNVAAGEALTGIQVTPLTGMAQSAAAHMSGGMTTANIASANSAVAGYFLVDDILHTAPMNPLQSGSGATASQSAMNYGMALAAMSQYAHGQGMAASSSFVTAMMRDASDGMMNGKMGTTPISMSMGGGMGPGMMQANAGTSGIAGAMSAFTGSTQNRSGVSATMMAPLINQLNSTTGALLPTQSQPNAVTVTGKVFNGPTHAATVQAFAVDNGNMGAQIASSATDAQGGFSMSLGSYSGPVMLQAVDATYSDMATQTVMTMGPGEAMTLVLPSSADNSALKGVWITPLTTMAQARAQGMTGGMTVANINAANMGVGNYFMVGDIAHTMPMDPTVPGAAVMATQDMKNCGAVIAAMSQSAQAARMPVSSSYVAAMMKDASDGMLDGKMNGQPIAMNMGAMMGSTMMSANAGTSGLASAMANFVSSARNVSGLTATDLAALLQKLSGSSGKLDLAP